jgi:hypothetical protein
MLTDKQINYINSNLDSLDLEDLDYKKLLELNVSESFILDFIEKYK